MGLVLAMRVAGDPHRPRGVRASAGAGAVPLALGAYLSFSRGALAAVTVGTVTLLARARRPQPASCGRGHIGRRRPRGARFDGAFDHQLARGGRAGGSGSGARHARRVAPARACGRGTVGRAWRTEPGRGGSSAPAAARGCHGGHRTRLPGGSAGPGGDRGSSGKRVNPGGSESWPPQLDRLEPLRLLGRRRGPVPRAAGSRRGIWGIPGRVAQAPGPRGPGERCPFALPGNTCRARADRFRPARHPSGRRRPKRTPLVKADPAAAAGLAAGCAAFAVHAGLDWDWEMPPVTPPPLLLAVALVGWSEGSLRSPVRSAVPVLAEPEVPIPELASAGGPPARTVSAEVATPSGPLGTPIW